MPSRVVDRSRAATVEGGRPGFRKHHVVAPRNTAPWTDNSCGRASDDAWSTGDAGSSLIHQGQRDAVRDRQSLARYAIDTYVLLLLLPGTSEREVREEETIWIDNSHL